MNVMNIKICNDDDDDDDDIIIIIISTEQPYWAPHTLRKVLLYEGESQGNIKSAIQIRNTARLSCKLATVILMVLRVADRWQYDTT